ncbi:MAG: DUF1835 domain-containing protein [Chitinophagaceae bacterium]|nr:DUF1835 domain-containing protein [Chitinophagaceae bacterium]
MIHIVFNSADKEPLQKAIELDTSLEGEIIQIKDDYAVGPLRNCYIAEGIEARKAWWQEVLAGTDLATSIDSGAVDDYKTVAEIVGRLRRNLSDVVWVWAAQNKHDVSGYYWLLHYLKEFQGRVYILYLNNLPFINEKGLIFYPQWLSEISPREFLKAKKLARLITPSEFEIDPDEWKRLCDENKGVRVLEGGKKLSLADYDFYDADLSKFITDDWQKASRVINQFLSKSKHTTGDVYVLWRLKEQVKADMLEMRSELRNTKDFEIRRKVAIHNSVQEQDI